MQTTARLRLAAGFQVEWRRWASSTSEKKRHLERILQAEKNAQEERRKSVLESKILSDDDKHNVTTYLKSKKRRNVDPSAFENERAFRRYAEQKPSSLSVAEVNEEGESFEQRMEEIRKRHSAKKQVEFEHEREVLMDALELRYMHRWRHKIQSLEEGKKRQMLIRKYEHEEKLVQFARETLSDTSLRKIRGLNVDPTRDKRPHTAGRKRS
mmetsp:Transcript_10903/g.33425  ORF Transcript_10903/g.33425 Transcript_10903/m.33425 type:complete len:211 (+) Transcript_10903:143-775(+)